MQWCGSARPETGGAHAFGLLDEATQPDPAFIAWVNDIAPGWAHAGQVLGIVAASMNPRRIASTAEPFWIASVLVATETDPGEVLQVHLIVNGADWGCCSAEDQLSLVADCHSIVTATRARFAAAGWDHIIDRIFPSRMLDAERAA